MREHTDMDRHILGEFQIGEESLLGEIIYNNESGIIWLKLEQEVPKGIGKSYGSIPLIVGKLLTGTFISLYQNKCIKNHTQQFSYQTVIFQSRYMILGPTQGKYNRLTCELENGLQWSGLSQVDMSEFPTVKFKGLGEHIYHLFNAKIKFSTSLSNDLFGFPRKEISRTIERLTMEIESEEKQDVAFFVGVRDKVISLISFAIKDNINIEHQFFTDFDDYDMINGQINYSERAFYSSEPRYQIFDVHLYDYNFTLQHLSDTADIQDALTKLEPIFNLYLSLFRYRHMPPEMIFLNMVQALETFHSRFFYNDKKEKYIESVYERFGRNPNFNHIEKLLLSDSQMDKNCNYIILVSRLNDLLIGQFNGLFSNFYMSENPYAQRIADTRHYYTHYGKSKEAKAFKGEDLLEAIYILRLLLEYYICQVLKVDIEDVTREKLATIQRNMVEKRNFLSTV